MSEIILAFAPTILEYTIGPIKRHISYPFNYASNAKTLAEHLQELENARVSVQHSVDDDKRRGKLIEEYVKAWLLQVDETIEKVRGELIQAENKAKRRCFVGLCPNLKTRYQISKKAEKEALDIAKLQSRYDKFKTIAHTAPLEWTSTGNYEAFESRMSVYDEIMNVLTAHDVNMIGVYGIGGVGKTTLAEEVATQAKEGKLFDEVFMVTITNDVQVKRIQGQIGDWLGLEFDEESVEGRAKRLYERLKREEKVLIILDDLWKKLDLDELGIPFNGQHKGCKILLTSRDLHVLSNGMGSQMNFVVGALPEDEAWDLFKKTTNDNFEDQDLRSTAMKVAKVCAGLPIAIVTVASALRGKSMAEWNTALRDLKRTSGNLTDIKTTLYSTIEFSYKKLESDELKSLFLLCSRMGYNATSGDLIKYGLGLGLFHGVTLEEVQDEVHWLVQRLKALCLLLAGNTDNHLVMHDVVRDVAISIASREQQMLIVNDEDEVKEWADEEKLKTYTTIVLRGNINELPEEMQCPELVFFHLDNKNPNLIVPDMLFEGSGKLKVLNLSSFYMPSLPPSLCFLENLKTLCLCQCEFENIGLVGELKKLEVLSFAKSKIKYLPTEIGQLTELRLLDLSDCSELEVILPNVLSRLKRLEGLYMGNGFNNWETDGLNNEGRKNASPMELEHLASLTNLDIHIPDVGILSKDVFSKRLCRYRIFVGDTWNWDGVFETSRTLILKLNGNIHMEDGVMPFLKKTEDLYLYGLSGVKNILTEWDTDGFPKLKHLHLYESPEIQYIINTAGMVAFPILESLILKELVSLEKICDHKLKMQSLDKLRIVEVEDCDRLMHLFSFLVAQGLSQLQNIRVYSCESMEEIVCGGSEVHGNIAKATNTIEFRQLRRLALRNLPKLRNFCSNLEAPCLGRRRSKLLEAAVGSEGIILNDGAKTPTPLFNERVLFPNLEYLTLGLINNETLWHNPLPAVAISFQNLTEMEVAECHNLKHLFPPSLVKCLAQLKYIRLWDCETMEEIIATEGPGEEQRMSKVSFPKLQSLLFYELPRLARFCEGFPMECPLLKQLTMFRCPELKAWLSNFISTSTPESIERQALNCQNAGDYFFDEKIAFPSLDEISITDNDKIERIWYSQIAASSFCELRKLSISGCGELKKLFQSTLVRRFQKLEVLKVRWCDMLEEIFEVEEGSSGEGMCSSSCFQLKRLELTNMERLKYIWNKDPQHILTFPNLHSVELNNCGVLKNVFPSSVARDLVNLEELTVRDCGVQEIVGRGEDDEATPHFMLPKLTSLTLKEVSRLRGFYPGLHSLKCPPLKKLDIDTGFYQGVHTELFANDENNEGQSDIQIQKPSFLQEKMVSSLEYLALDCEHGFTYLRCPDNFLAKLSPELKVLQLSYIGHEWIDGVPFRFLQKLHKLEKLSLHNSALEELFSYDGVSGEVDHTSTTLSRLKHLNIDSLSDLRYIWKQNRWLPTFLQNLKTLEVKWCRSLVSLAPSLVSFRNVTTLRVSHCPELLNLITTPTAKSLSQLVSLEVDNCETVAEIIDKEGDDTEAEIIFTKLQRMKLVSLRSLTCFCSGNYTFRFPLLEDMTIEGCPKMRDFSPRLSVTPKLHKICLKRYNDKEKRWGGSLDTTIQQIFAEMVGFDGIQKLKLSEFPELKEIWLGALPVRLLNKLRSLEVDNCSFFLNAVSSNLLPSLNHLKELYVGNCDSLKEVFDLERLNVGTGHVGLLPELTEMHLSDLPRLTHIWSKNTNRILEFKKLRRLTIHNCSSLRNIFSTSTALGLPLLHKIKIRNCTMLTEVVSKEREEEAKTDGTMFPLLDDIILESLPNLTNINSGNGILEFSSLERITIKNCPNMKPFISSLLKGQVPKRSYEAKEPSMGKRHLDIQTTLVSTDMVAFPCLEELSLEWNDTMEEIACGHVQALFFGKLKVLEVINFPSDHMVFPSHFLHRFPNLVELVVSNALFEEIILHEGTTSEDLHPEALAKLRILKLFKLPKLMRLAKEDSQLCLVFQRLENFEVLECGILEILVPSSISFQCLMTMKVSKCHELLYLITSAAARSLVQLTRMSVIECRMIEQIVSNEEDEMQNKVIFSKLEFLELDYLPCLMGFSLWNCAFTFPSLKEVLIRGCANMKIFSQGVIRTPILRRVYLTEGKDQWCWKGSLNATIQKLFMEKDQAFVQPTQSSSPNQPNLDVTTVQMGENGTLGSSKGTISKDLHVPMIPDATKDVSLDNITTPTITTKEVVRGSYTTPEITQKEEPTMTRNTSTTLDIEDLCFPQIRKDPEAIAESTGPASSPNAVELDPASIFATPMDRDLPLELTLPVSSGRSETQPAPCTETSSQFPADFEFVLARVEQLLSTSLVSPSQLMSRSNTDVESQVADGNMALMKEILTKTLAEVARSDDGILLLSTLKKLSNCPLLNSQQSEIVRVYIENFECLVTNQPFYEHQIDRTCALKSSIQDDMKEIGDLKINCEDLTSKTNALTVEKEALNKRLREIEDEEEDLHKKRDALFSEYLKRKQRVETRMDTLSEAMQQQREAENRVNNAYDHWAKIRSLFD